MPYVFVAQLSVHFSRLPNLLLKPQRKPHEETFWVSGQREISVIETYVIKNNKRDSIFSGNTSIK